MAEGLHKAVHIEQKAYHYAFAFRRNNLIAVGRNNPLDLSAKALKFGKKFNLEHFKTYPYVHAEVDLVVKMWGRQHIDRDIKVVVIRLSKIGELRNSMPCRYCSTLLRALNVRNVWWSNNDGTFKHW